MTSSLTQFKGVYCSGIFIPDAKTVTALSLLFEKVHLPNNIELVKEFSKRYSITTNKAAADITVDIKPIRGDEDPFEGLTERERETAISYLKWGISFIHTYGELFPEVFETRLFPKSEPLKVKLIKKGRPGELNLYRVSSRPLTLKGGDEEVVPRLLSKGYIPVVGHYHSSSLNPKQFDKATAKQLAALLAMKSVEMLLPSTKGADPELILEARHKLADHLPPFWSSMLKLSVEMKKLIRECRTSDEVIREAQETVDTVIRPALIDLQQKMIQERKDWFYKILSPVQKGLRLLVGNPPLTQQQLLTNALVLGADVTMNAAENMRTIDALKREAGLTFLLEANKLLNRTKIS